MKKILSHPLLMFILGLIFGFMSRLFDIYCQVLGNIFSQMAVWILLGTLISVFSQTKKKAMLNIFLFSIAMLFTYYLTAVLTDGIYGKEYIIGWTIFACLSPIFAYFAWMTKQDGLFSLIIGFGIVIVSIFSSIILFDHLRFYDFIIDGLLIYIIFFMKIERK